MFGIGGPEPGLTLALERFGTTIAMYGSDYPHWDMEFPDSALELASDASLTEDVRRALLSRNATAFYAPRTSALSADGPMLDAR